MAGRPGPARAFPACSLQIAGSLLGRRRPRGYGWQPAPAQLQTPDWAKLAVAPAPALPVAVLAWLPSVVSGAQSLL